jgi:hypothetical protein
MKLHLQKKIQTSIEFYQNTRFESIEVLLYYKFVKRFIFINFYN